ncbi:MAG: hypothetical protein J5I52_09840 [Saprospiraceae bacterium]|nr:MAG: hypothetical protein UZ09_BCD002001163 [Bacteroidetes bacterium OLB9]MCO6464434.1 hypothetical protein [Saprospiraceae bacterium]MCZ2336594.1 hypothetical protein [Chitinophagales bacterium]
MKKIEKILKYFPETSLPVVVSEDYLHVYEEENVPLPLAFIQEIMVEWEKEIDEFTEFVACFSLPKEEKFHTVVYWRGSLLRYDFIMVTLDLNGNMISKKSIANTIYERKVIKKSVASIEPDLIIHIMAGQAQEWDDYDASTSRDFTMEILPSGEIIFSMDE